MTKKSPSDSITGLVFTPSLDCIQNVDVHRDGGAVVFALSFDYRAQGNSDLQKEIAKLFAKAAKKVFLRPVDAIIQDGGAGVTVSWPESGHFPGERSLADLQQQAVQKVILAAPQKGPTLG